MIVGTLEFFTTKGLLLEGEEVRQPLSPRAKRQRKTKEGSFTPPRLRSGAGTASRQFETENLDCQMPGRLPILAVARHGASSLFPPIATMKIPRLFTAGLLALALAPASLPAAEKASSSPVDPAALAPLQRMSATLAGAKAFTYQSKSILEVPAVTGQFITIFSEARVAVQRPNKIAAQLGGEAPRFNFYYDGKTVSAFAPGTNVFSTTPAPSTIDAMLPDLQAETGIRFATSPLLTSDPYRAITRGLTSAVVVGPANVNGVACQHLAFRAPGMNWEIWVEDNSSALPRRLAVTFTNRPNFPRTIVEFTHWNLHPWLRGSDFVFKKPAGAKEIPFASVWKSRAR